MSDVREKTVSEQLSDLFYEAVTESLNAENIGDSQTHTERSYKYACKALALLHAREWVAAMSDAEERD